MRRLCAWTWTVLHCAHDCCSVHVSILTRFQIKLTQFVYAAGLKFQILQEFLQLGYAVLLSDVDIVTISNPFNHLVRDSDVEGMSDGWDDPKAYGTC